MNLGGVRRLAVLLCALPALSWPADPHQPTADEGLTGTWLAPAEDPDDVDALIALTPSDDAWQGHIQAIRETRPGQKWHDDSLCVACPSPAQGHTFKGLRVLWDVRPIAAHQWQGWTLDPSDGHVYRCRLTLSADQRTLDVKAYMGLPAFGHKMTWSRWP